MLFALGWLQRNGPALEGAERKRRREHGDMGKTLPHTRDGESSSLHRDDITALNFLLFLDAPEFLGFPDCLQLDGGLYAAFQ